MTPEIGLHSDIPFAEYQTWDAINQSSLKKAQRSLAHCRVPEAPSDEMEFGTFVHSYILLPDELLDRYVVSPKFDRRTKQGKADSASFAEANAGKQLVTADDLDAAKAMRSEIWNHPTAGGIVREATGRELSAAWEIDGILCKGRMDILTHPDRLADLKTTRDASPRWFPAECAKYGYHIQGAFYCDGVGVLVDPVEEFTIIAVEKEPPFAVCVYRLNPDAMEIGRGIYMRLLREYADAKRLGIWPGYPDEIQPLSLPEWAKYDAADPVVEW